MSNKAGKRLVPALRFPEFADCSTWRLHPLGSVGKTVGGLSGKSAEDFGKGSPFVTYKQIFDNSFVALDKCGFVRIENDERQNEVAYGDVLITGSSETPDEVGFASVVLEKPFEKTYLNSFCFAFRPDTLLLRVPRFSQFLFHSPWYRAEVRHLAQGSTRFNISKLGFLKLKLPIPAQDEQQKIADCLSSLDDLIAAQAKKIEALKAHKKGMMQQLFPAEGETVPRLRFPEFRNMRGWEDRRFGNLLQKAIRPLKMENDQKYSLVTVKRRYGGVEARSVLKGWAIKVKSQFSIKANDFLISKRQIVHCACGVVPKRLENSIVSNEYSVLEAKPECDIDFFWYFSQQSKVSESFLASSRGIVIEKMLFDLDYWLKIKFLFPQFPEQQKIGRFLTSIDNRIDAENRKIKALKTQKQGLMQGLFPSINEAEE